VGDVVNEIAARAGSMGLPSDAIPMQPADLVKQAAAILGRETMGGPASLPASPSLPASASLPSWDGAMSETPLKAPAPDVDSFRRYAHELLDGLLSLLGRGEGGAAETADANERVPLLRMPAPGQPGTEVSMPIVVSNEESSPVEVTLYSSNFISDSGFEIPSLRLSFSPSAITLQPKSRATFQVKVAIPAQAPRGLYSGLVQAAGLTYVKTVVTVEVQ
jgi:hypothetical protein